MVARGGEGVFLNFRWRCVTAIPTIVVRGVQNIYATNNVHVARDGRGSAIVRTIVNYYQTHCHCSPDECVVVAVQDTRPHAHTCAHLPTYDCAHNDRVFTVYRPQRPTYNDNTTCDCSCVVFIDKRLTACTIRNAKTHSASKTVAVSLGRRRDEPFSRANRRIDRMTLCQRSYTRTAEDIFISVFVSTDHPVRCEQYGNRCHRLTLSVQSVAWMFSILITTRSDHRRTPTGQTFARRNCLANVYSRAPHGTADAYEESDYGWEVWKLSTRTSGYFLTRVDSNDNDTFYRTRSYNIIMFVTDGACTRLRPRSVRTATARVDDAYYYGFTYVNGRLGIKRNVRSTVLDILEWRKKARKTWFKSMRNSY